MCLAIRISVMDLGILGTNRISNTVPALSVPPWLSQSHRWLSFEKITGLAPWNEADEVRRIQSVQSRAAQLSSLSSTWMLQFYYHHL